MCLLIGEPPIVTLDTVHGSNGRSETEFAPRSPQRNSFTRRLVGGTFNYGLGQSIPKFISFLLLPIYTRLLSPTDYGFLDNAIAVRGFLMMLMRQGVCRGPLHDTITTTRRGRR